MTASSADGEALRFSAYQYTPASLVYADDQWAETNLVDVPARSGTSWRSIGRARLRTDKGALCERQGPRSAAAADMGSGAD
eukprot:14664541-Alexandrium_andersonii.AAC.1